MTEMSNARNAERNIAQRQREWISVGPIGGDQIVDSVREWKRNLPSSSSRYVGIEDKPVTSDVLMSMRLTFAAYWLQNLIEIDPNRAGGAPVLTGSRFKVSQVLAEIADGKSVKGLAREFALDREKLETVLHALAIYMDRSLTK